jgi:AraC-like DNA-binding protein
MLYVIGVSIALFLALIILTKKGQNLSDVILGIWMIVVGIHLFSYYGSISGLIYQHPFFLGFNLPIPFLHGPFLYLYTLALTNPSRISKKSWLIHCFLPILVIFLFIPFLQLSAEEKIIVLKNNGKGYETILLIARWLLRISGIIYVILNFILLQKHKKRILNQFSNQEKVNLDWLRFLFYVMAMMWVLIIWIRKDNLIFSAATIFIVFIGYFGIKQVGIFTNKTLEAIENEPAVEVTAINIDKKKYAKSGLNEDTAKELHQRLQSLMQQEKLFTEPELTLSDLAKKLEIHPNYLSQIINEIEGVNFYDYINGLRIEEFKRLVALPENQKFTLLSIAYECGFNSKASFNRFFKKATELSPSEYVKKLS